MNLFQPDLSQELEAVSPRESDFTLWSVKVTNAVVRAEFGHLFGWKTSTRDQAAVNYGSREVGSEVAFSCAIKQTFGIRKSRCVTCILATRLKPTVRD